MKPDVGQFYNWCESGDRKKNILLYVLEKTGSMPAGKTFSVLIMDSHKKDDIGNVIENVILDRMIRTPFFSLNLELTAKNRLHMLDDPEGKCLMDRVLSQDDK